MKAENFVLVLAGITGLLSVPAVFGYRVNITSSMPVGIYRFTHAHIGRGDTAVFCLKSNDVIHLAVSRKYLGSGQCPGYLRPLVKTVAALPGDRIAFTENQQIAINGRVIPNSTIQSVDSHNRKMTSILKAGIIPAGRALMLSTHNSKSFDSRYFGLIPLADLQAVKPVLTFK